MIGKRSKFNKKIIILGFDGLSPAILEQMMDVGELPHFSRLRARGFYAHLSTTNPSQSPVAWAGFATGQNPGKNGIYDFIIREPKTYNLSLSLSRIEKGRPRRVVKSKSFWQYTSQKNIPTVIIGCPLTFPPDKVYGRLLSGMGVPDILGTEGTFTFYTTEPLKGNKDVGGKVFEVEPSPEMILNLIGPRIREPGGGFQNVKSPFKVILTQEDRVFIEYGNKKFELRPGQWSNWQEVSFKLGLFRVMRGIFKFYLVELRPHFKLYISPINFDPRHPYFPLSYPKSYSRELAERIGLYYTQGMPIDTWAVNEGRLSEKPLLEQAMEVLREKKAMLDLELDRFEEGLLFCYFESPDIIQHMFWHYQDPQHPLYQEDAPEEYRKIIREWYKKMDSILGEVMAEIDPEDYLIVISDHGFNTFRRAVHINTWLRENGYLELKNPEAEMGRELLMDVDWSNTRAYSIGFGAIYINQKGREGEGIVKPGKEKELLKEEIRKKLKGWIDEKYNKPVVKEVYAGEDIFWGDYTNQTPDLYIGFNLGYRASWQTALGAVPDRLIEDNLKKWSGDHLFDPSLIPGVLFSNKKIEKENPSIYDIAPTILSIVGFDKREIEECNFDGEPLF